MPDLTTTTYAIYITVSVSMTIWVARTLHRNGRAFLVDAFGKNEKLADSVNHLLVVGFYLLNLGYVSLMLKAEVPPADVAQAIEVLSLKLGWVSVGLGLFHFFNIYLFSRFRRSGLLDCMTAPVTPDGSLVAENR